MFIRARMKLALGTLMLLSLAGLAGAQDGYSVESLNGTYSAAVTFTPGNNFNQGAVHSVFTFDGEGNITNGTRSLLWHGESGLEAIDQTFTGTYEVGADGRGRATLQVSEPIEYDDPSPRPCVFRYLPTEEVEFLIMADARELRFHQQLSVELTGTDPVCMGLDLTRKMYVGFATRRVPAPYFGSSEVRLRLGR